MTPEMRVRLSAQNNTGAGFAEVQRDAVQAANAVQAAGQRAATGMMRLGDASRMAAAQQRNLAFQLNDVAVSLASGMNPMMVFMQQGSQIATIYGPSEGGVGRALKETGNLAVGLVTKFWPIAAVVGVGTAAVAGMTAEINKTSKAQVSFGDVALASWQVFADGAYDLAQPAISAVTGWIGGMWEAVAPHVLTLGNGLIGTFVGAFDASKIAWGAMPAVMGDIAITTANNVIGGVEGMVNGAIDLLNNFTRFADDALGDILPDSEIGRVDFGGIANPFEGATSGLGEGVADAMSKAMGVDYLGKIFEAISARAEDNALARLAADGEKAAKALKAANDTIDPLAARMQELSGVLELTRDPFEQMKLDLTDLATLWENGRISVEQYQQAVSRTTLNTAAETLGMVGQLTGAFAQLFEGNKAFAVANAVVNTAEGITKALAQGGIFGFIGAAAVAASGAAQIATILSASPGSSTRPSVGAGGAVASPSAPVAAAAPAGPTINLTLKGGGRYSRDEIEDLFRDINDALGDGAKLNMQAA